ncbi:VpaChn25_0724 family phage protein [Bosea sp. MMO-172]|uniref:VpaChn25_0724 family phage protein n=1 Tax=Bosea sp. MMO-172 TaxID=3127885 RepID=UPI00301A6282
MSMDTFIREEARLIILKALAAQPDESLQSELLRRELATYAIRREREWVHDELRWLEQMGAVSVVAAGTVLIPTLTEKGARHLAREIAIEGVKRPSRPK